MKRMSGSAWNTFDFQQGRLESNQIPNLSKPGRGLIPILLKPDTSCLCSKEYSQINESHFRIIVGNHQKRYGIVDWAISQLLDSKSPGYYKLQPVSFHIDVRQIVKAIFYQLRWLVDYVFDLIVTKVRLSWIFWPLLEFGHEGFQGLELARIASMWDTIDVKWSDGRLAEPTETEAMETDTLTSSLHWRLLPSLFPVCARGW